MKTTSIFKGCGTAIVTPFKDDSIDFDALAKIIDFQIANHADALIVCGTTGESSTLSDMEKLRCISFAVKHVNGRIPVIAGTGTNDTSRTVSLSAQAAMEGVNGLLIVTPYYNKASDTGMIRHYLSVASATDCPIILYNVPSRTGCNLSIPVCKELAKCPGITAIKDASANIIQIASLFSQCSRELDIYSGNDEIILPFLSLGGSGVISVAANIIPHEIHNLCKYYASGNVKDATSVQLKYMRLINLLFCETNPIPIKTAMEQMNFCSSQMRLPLCEMTNNNKQLIIEEMKKLKLI